MLLTSLRRWSNRSVGQGQCRTKLPADGVTKRTGTELGTDLGTEVEVSLPSYLHPYCHFLGLDPSSPR